MACGWVARFVGDINAIFADQGGHIAFPMVLNARCRRSRRGSAPIAARGSTAAEGAISRQK